MSLGVVEVSIQTRCPNFGHGHVEPCPSCYSLAITSVSIPYRPPVRHLEITTRTTEAVPPVGGGEK